jgi:hypothetical protein
MNISYCDDPKIYRWTIIKNPEGVNFIYTRDSLQTGELYFKPQRTLKDIILNSTSSTFVLVVADIAISQRMPF